MHTVDADLNDKAALQEMFSLCKPTHVLNLAGQAGVRYAVKNPDSYVQSNIAGFVTLLESIKALDPLPALIYASSSSVYGLNKKVRGHRQVPRRPPLGGLWRVGTRWRN